MHALANVPLPAHDEKTDAVLLYGEENLTVLSADKFRTTVRRAYKILRPEGRDYGTVEIPFDSLNEKVTSIHAWCIPAGGKDYEVTDKDAVEVSPLKGHEILITDAREKSLQIPAPDPGNIVGYEYVMEQRPLVLQDVWGFQETIPVRESHYSLTLPPGWEFKDAWLNYPGSESSRCRRRSVAMDRWGCERDSRERGHAAVAGGRRADGRDPLPAGWRSRE